MIGVINPNKTFTLAAQKEYVENATIVLQPGMYLGSEASPSSSSSTTSSTTAPTSPAVVSSSSSTETDKPSHVSLSTGAIAGIAVGGAVIVVLVGALFWYMSRSRILKQTLEQQRSSVFQLPPKDAFGAGDDRWSSSYAGSPAPDKRMAQPMETVYDIDRHGSPELEAFVPPRIEAISGHHDRGRNLERHVCLRLSKRFKTNSCVFTRWSATSELESRTRTRPVQETPDMTQPVDPVHEIG